jgi:basic membrane protein A
MAARDHVVAVLLVSGERIKIGRLVPGLSSFRVNGNVVICQIQRLGNTFFSPQKSNFTWLLRTCCIGPWATLCTPQHPGISGGNVRKSLRAVALAAAATLALTGIAATSAQAAAKVQACMVTDTGGIDDHSFNAAAYRGLVAAQKLYKVQIVALSSSSDADYAPNITQLISAKCDLIVTVGFLMADAVLAAAKANPNTKFAIIDSDGKDHGSKGDQYPGAVVPNQAGYLAAGYSKKGKVATYGGINIPPVTIFMDGFWEGVNAYNKANKKSVKVLGWDEVKKNGTFAGSFTDVAKGQQITKNFEQQGADVIFPVAGGVGAGSAKQAMASKKSKIIWVDSDAKTAAPQFMSVILTTVVKGVDASVTAAVKELVGGTFSANSYVGTLANGGTSIAPLYGMQKSVPASLWGKVMALKAKIASGAIKITSPSQP